MSNEKLNKVEKLISGRSPEEALALLGKEFLSRSGGLPAPKESSRTGQAGGVGGGLVFSTSFGLEDQAITHIIFSKNIPIKVFTLDTGRLFTETYAVWSRTRERYGKNIEVYSPNAEAVQKMVSAKGPNSFYESVDNRKECCHIRKVEPLQRALKGNAVWITGIRREQSQNRQGLTSVEWDEKNKIVKFHPLFDWSYDEVKKFISHRFIKE